MSSRTFFVWLSLLVNVWMYGMLVNFNEIKKGLAMEMSFVLETLVSVLYLEYKFD